MTGARGASEVIGFVLVFAVVFAGTGVVYTAGFDALSDLRHRERVESAERAFVTLSGNLDDLQYGASVRAGTLRLGAGRLRVHDGPVVVAWVDGTRHRIRTGALSYRLGTARVTYASGAVLRDRGDRAALVRPPTVRCRPGIDAAVISVASFRPNATGLDTDGPVEIVVRERSTAVWDADRVAVNVSAATARDAWSRYFERSRWNGSATRGYDCAANRTFVRRTTLSVRFVY